MHIPFVQAGSMAGFLKELLLQDCPFADLVQVDFQRCMEVHFQDMPSVVPHAPGQPAQPSQTLLTISEPMPK